MLEKLENLDAERNATTIQRSERSPKTRVRLVVCAQRRTVSECMKMNGNAATARRGSMADGGWCGGWGWLAGDVVAFVYVHVVQRFAHVVVWWGWYIFGHPPAFAVRGFFLLCVVDVFVWCWLLVWCVMENWNVVRLICVPSWQKCDHICIEEYFYKYPFQWISQIISIVPSISYALNFKSDPF